MIDRETRAELPALAEQYDARLVHARPERIEAIIGYLAMAFPSSKLSDQEAQARLSMYVDGLSDLPEEVLQQVAREAVRRFKFFPTVAELREVAEPIMGRLRWPGVAIRSLMRKHDEEWRDPAELLPPEEAKAALQEVRQILEGGLKSATA